VSFLFHFFSGKEAKKTFWVLKNINFSAMPGEVVGIAGPNGAGKSTLLTLIADVYKADSGEVKVDGKVISIIGLIHGLHDKLTTKENIPLLCSLYGLEPAEISKKQDSIITFAGLEKYADTKVFQFSTGMLARLIFSTAIHCNPDILLLDEVTSNLDKEFTEVVSSAIRRLTKQGVTVLIVSHKREIIEGCDRAIIIDKGELLREGKSADIADIYFGNKKP
jgi:ABC-type polysaccharide/polyol phosphate transport system ATPase subunit